MSTTGVDLGARWVRPKDCEGSASGQAARDWLETGIRRDTGKRPIRDDEVGAVAVPDARLECRKFHRENAPVEIE
jgi:hypothetical protein